MTRLVFLQSDCRFLLSCVRMQPASQRMQFKGLGFPNKHFATQMVFV